MRSTFSDAHRPDEPSVRRTLLVVWQDVDTRRFQTVARLDQFETGGFRFKYLPGARAENFYPLEEYPDLDRAYLSEALPAFFANRVMSSGRENYSQYLTWTGLEGAVPADVPVELLARTGGARATDTFHLVDYPVRNDEAFQSRFFVSGLRHTAGGIEQVEVLRAGDELELVSQPDNPQNSKAVVVNVQSGEQIGWVPDWLCDEVNELIGKGWKLSAVAERVNLDAPPQTRVLCAISAVPR